MRFDLGSLALSGFLHVFGRQPPHRGLVLVVAPELPRLVLTVQPPPRVFAHAVFVEVVADEMPVVATKKKHFGIASEL